MYTQEYLNRLVVSQSIPHLMLFAGHDNPSLEKAAKSFAFQLLFDQDKSVNLEKIYPEIHEYRPEGKTGIHLLESLKSLKSEIWLKSVHSRYKIFIIYRADQMLPSGANAMLKMFEEPAVGSVVILTTSNLNRMLPTIISRSRVIHFPYGEPRSFSEWEKQLLSLVQERPFSYSKIKSFCNSFEAYKKNKEKELKKAFQQNNDYNEENAKELAGALSVWFKDEVQRLLEVIFLWYRDIFLQAHRLQNQYGSFKNFNKSSSMKVVSLKSIETLLENANLFLEKSGKFSACLEWLFCKLEQLEFFSR